jgi:hypothetical protein
MGTYCLEDIGNSDITVLEPPRGDRSAVQNQPRHVEARQRHRRSPEGRLDRAIRAAMILGLVFVETLALFTLVIIFVKI